MSNLVAIVTSGMHGSLSGKRQEPRTSSVRGGVCHRQALDQGQPSKDRGQAGEGHRQRLGSVGGLARYTGECGMLRHRARQNT